ncbi:B3 DNA binding domain-containing protein [Dioscorea alata]|uniref:B3 DNA binding domain-containing protein n=1 Tax=Dioscorea alata TaxID=55571 RepID=A0ACB7WDR1_DIOAL|nr:B3 DNA binding domain-containing protein [Dioscorea alata]
MAAGARGMASFRCPSFFKVFLPNLSAQHLKIPPAFLKHIVHEEEARTVSLEGPSGSVWCVEMVRNSGGVWFENGWKEFVADHSVVMGDFLVFCYTGDSSFRVLLFDSTACQKEAAFCARPSQAATVLGEDIDEDDCKDLFMRALEKNAKKKKRVGDASDVDDSQRKVRSSLAVHSDSHSGPFEFLGAANGGSSFDEADGSTPKEGTGALMTLKSCGKQLHSNIPNRKTYIPKSRRGELTVYVPRIKPTTPKPQYQVKQEIDFTEEETLSNKLIRSGEMSTVNVQSKVKSNCLALMESSGPPQCNEDDVKLVRLGSLLSQRRPVTKDEMDRTIEMAKSFNSQNPFFAVVMREAYVYSSFFMNVPHTFVKQYFPETKTEMILWDSEGKRWPIMYNSYGRRGGFSAGWGKFSRNHNIEKDDVCIFELIKEYEMRVHIYRVVEEISPLVRIRRKDL